MPPERQTPAWKKIKCSLWWWNCSFESHTGLLWSLLTSGFSHGGVITLVGWFFAFPSHIACDFHPKNISIKRLLFFSSTSISSLFFYFTFPLCLPNTTRGLQFPNLHTVSLHRHSAVCIKSDVQKQSVIIFVIPVKPQQLNLDIFHILIMLSPKACWDFSHTFWKWKEVRKGQGLGKGNAWGSRVSLAPSR